MNKKGFADTYFFAPITIILYIICWIYIFGPILAQQGTQIVINNGYTGLDAIIWNTMNIWAGLLPLIAYIIFVGYYGGNQ